MYVCVFDFETGGFESSKHAITQLAYSIASFENFLSVTEKNFYIKPYNKDLVYTKEALEFTKTNMLMLESGIEIKKVLETFYEDLKKYTSVKSPKNKIILCGHNIKFDIRFLRKTLKDFGFFDDFCKILKGDKDEEGVFLFDYIDTLQLSIIQNPLEKSHKLSDICTLYGIDLTNAHNALEDVKATKELLKRITFNNKNNFQNQEKEVKKRVGFQF